MAHQQTNTYEGFFLFPQSASGDLQGASDHVGQILDRGGAEILSFSKWDERRLAYEIKGNKRGIYFLSYFKATGDKIAAIERSCNLSEQLLRFMITRADHVPGEIIEAAEGRDKLADEIKLRAEKESSGESGESSRVESKAEVEAEDQKKSPDEAADSPAERGEADAQKSEATADA